MVRRGRDQTCRQASTSKQIGPSGHLWHIFPNALAWWSPPNFVVMTLSPWLKLEGRSSYRENTKNPIHAHDVIVSQGDQTAGRMRAGADTEFGIMKNTPALVLKRILILCLVYRIAASEGTGFLVHILLSISSSKVMFLDVTGRYLSALSVTHPVPVSDL